MKNKFDSFINQNIYLPPVHVPLDICMIFLVNPFLKVAQSCNAGFKYKLIYSLPAVKESQS